MNTNTSTKLQAILGKFSQIVNKNIYIQAIKDGMLSYVPFTIIASVFLIIGSFPIPEVTDWLAGLFHVQPTIFTSRLGIVNDASLAIGGIIVLIGVAKNLAKQMNLDDTPLILTALVSFLIITPYQVTKIAGSVIPVTSVGAQAIFLAMIVAIGGAILYRSIVRKGITIILPASVPPAVAKPFESLIPSFTVISFFWLIRILMDSYLHISALDLINNTLAVPLKALGGSIIGVVIAKLFSQFLWFFGIHGDSIVNSVMTPILQVLQDQNKTATLAHKAVPNIINQSFWDQYASIGVIGAILAITIVATSSRYKALKKVALVPYLFNIGEPTLFGIPLMLDFTFFIPLVISNAVSSILAYISFATGLVPIPTGLVQVPWTTPLIASGILVTGSWRGGLLQLVILIAVTLIWIPFIKKADKRNLQLELNEVKE